MSVDCPSLPEASMLALRTRELRAPRYTSYPTALEMKAPLDVERFMLELQRTNTEPVPADLSLYMHLPFCASACYYCGCNRSISSNKERHAAYLKTLQAEMVAAAKRTFPDRTVRQIHFGGGTPNLLAPEQLHGLLTTIRTHYQVAEDCEISLEIDPRHASVTDVAAWADFGINRLSIGVQDSDPAVQLAVNRVQSMPHIAELRTAAKQAGFTGVNLDLIIGLPKQTRRTFRRTLDEVLKLRPERVAVFQYAHMPQIFPAQRAIRALDLPNMDDRFAIQDDCKKRLLEAGYRHIGLDHYALPTDSLAVAQQEGFLKRNFQGYTVLSECDLLGFGVSAISQVGCAIVQNIRDIGPYEEAIAAGELAYERGFFRSPDDLMRADIIEELMCHGRTNRADSEYFPDAWTRIEQLDPDQCWVRRENKLWDVTAEGRSFLRLIAQCFDASQPVSGGQVRQLRAV